MKIRLSVLAVTVLFSMGLAFHANNLESVEVLSENNVEALSQGGGDPAGGSNCPYMIFGEAPDRIIVDMETHVVVFENKAQVYDAKGKALNGCRFEPGGVCVVSTTTWVYNVGEIVSYLESFLNALNTSMPLIKFIVGLFS
jgi:hypothetical protein